ncbi:MAG: hypothetical protein QM785_04890 [Pyrinomonadaceae bacterium]
MKKRNVFSVFVFSYTRGSLILTLLVFAVFSVQKVAACTCSIETDSIKHYFDTSDSVFSGQIVAVKQEKAKITVDKVWKGDTEAGLYVVDPYFGTSCGNQPKKGAKYIFFVFSGNSYSAIPEFNDVKTPIRRDNLQVFFSAPCWFSSPIDSFDQAVKQFEEKYWSQHRR